MSVVRLQVVQLLEVSASHIFCPTHQKLRSGRLRMNICQRHNQLGARVSIKTVGWASWNSCLRTQRPTGASTSIICWPRPMINLFSRHPQKKSTMKARNTSLQAPQSRPRPAHPNSPGRDTALISHHQCTSQTLTKTASNPPKQPFCPPACTTPQRWE